MRKLGIPAREDFARRYDWEEIRAYYEAGHSMTACRRRFGFSYNAWWDAIRGGAIKPRRHGQPLSLELHHVNGDGLDNRLENLQLLCPNCHSQTDTWGGLNKGRRAA